MKTELAKESEYEVMAQLLQTSGDVRTKISQQLLPNISSSWFWDKRLIKAKELRFQPQYYSGSSEAQFSSLLSQSVTKYTSSVMSEVHYARGFTLLFVASSRQPEVCIQVSCCV